jgi:hypothetical protein
MNRQKLWEHFAALSPAARRRVLQLIGALKDTKPKRQTAKRHSPLSLEPFIGMWQDRADLADSSAWVKNLRRREWDRNRG